MVHSVPSMHVAHKTLLFVAWFSAVCARCVHVFFPACLNINTLKGAQEVHTRIPIRLDYGGVANLLDSGTFVISLLFPNILIRVLYHERKIVKIAGDVDEIFLEETMSQILYLGPGFYLKNSKKMSKSYLFF